MYLSHVFRTTHVASQHRHPSIAALLLKFGADVDAEDNDGTTSLLLASRPSVVLFALDNGSTTAAQLLTGAWCQCPRAKQERPDATSGKVENTYLYLF